ncbi:MAG: ABC transporter ATP-binding protein [Chitinophagales bacterium]|nr:ABC transporter ATP-binding protein [Chitinophagales bacterium]
MLTINNLTKSFGRFRALDNVSVQLDEGQVVALIGPNGSGKTTLLKCILGLVIPDSGDIQLKGQNVLYHWGYRRSIGYMPQIGRYPDNMRVRQVFEVIREIRNSDETPDTELMEAFGVPQFENKMMRTLSGGTRQKVSACLAFLFNPPVLILDEPTAGLDPLSVEILKDKIQREKQKGKLILITSHILSDLDELTTHVLYLMDGKIRVHQSMDALKAETGEGKLNRAIAQLMKQDAHATH